MARLVIVGGGFAGVWAALAAAKTRARHAASPAQVVISLVSRDPWLTVRPRLYEASLQDVRVPLDTVLAPAGIERVEATVTGIDASAHSLELQAKAGARTGGHVLPYDRLVLAAGSRAHRPAVEGLEHAFTVDSYPEALALQRHLSALAGATAVWRTDARSSAVVVGAGLTGLEVATELVARLAPLAAGDMARPRVALVDGAASVGHDLGAETRRHVGLALDALGIERHVGRKVIAVRPGGVALSGGEWIDAATTVWAAGLRASELASQLPVERDELGRVAVDAFLRVRGVEGVYAAGDVARARADATHIAPMSCQHAIPMGSQAGHNAIAELLGAPMAPYSQPDYVTCLDLGAAGAVFTQGWEREVRLSGFWAKMMKQTINTRLIYPPRATRAAPPARELGDRSTA